MKTFKTLRYNTSLVILGILLAAVPSAFAQNNNPIEFSYDYPRIGADIGLSSVWQSGVYQAGCGTFTEGAGANLLIAAAYDRPMGSSFRFEALAGYQGRSVSSSYNSKENVVLNTNNGLVHVDVDFENIGNANFAYFFLLPSVKYYITKGLFAGAGVSLNLLASSSTQYTKNIISKTVTLGELGISTVSYPESESSDPFSKVFPEEDLPDASGFGLDGAFYVGGEFRVNKRILLAPRILYTLPLNAVLTTPEELKLNSLQFLIGFRYEIYN